MVKRTHSEAKKKLGSWVAPSWETHFNKAPYHFTATTALMNFLLFVALTLLHTKP